MVLLALALSGMGFGDGPPETAIADAFSAAGLGWLTFVIYLTALVGITVSLFSNLMATVRNLQALSKENLLPRFLGVADPATGIPVQGCYFVTVLIGLSATIFDVEALSLLTSLCNLITYQGVASCYLLSRFGESQRRRISMWVAAFFLLSIVSVQLFKTDYSWAGFTTLLVCAYISVKIAR